MARMGEERGAYRVLVRKPEGKRPLGRSRRRSVDNTVCPTRYRTRNFFNNSNTNEDITTIFEQEYVRCVRNEEECVCSPLQISLQYPH